MGLLLSILITSVGVMEVLGLYSHFRRNFAVPRATDFSEFKRNRIAELKNERLRILNAMKNVESIESSMNTYNLLSKSGKVINLADNRLEITQGAVKKTTGAEITRQKVLLEPPVLQHSKSQSLAVEKVKSQICDILDDDSSPSSSRSSSPYPIGQLKAPRNSIAPDFANIKKETEFENQVVTKTINDSIASLEESLQNNDLNESSPDNVVLESYNFNKREFWSSKPLLERKTRKYKSEKKRYSESGINLTPGLMKLRHTSIDSNFESAANERLIRDDSLEVVVDEQEFFNEDFKRSLDGIKLKPSDQRKRNFRQKKKLSVSFKDSHEEFIPTTPDICNSDVETPESKITELDDDSLGMLLQPNQEQCEVKEVKDDFLVTTSHQEHTHTDEQIYNNNSAPVKQSASEAFWVTPKF